MQRELFLQRAGCVSALPATAVHLQLLPTARAGRRILPAACARAGCLLSDPSMCADAGCVVSDAHGI